MSTRLYPLYQKGNPQLRIFLPNFWMKMIRPKAHQPPNRLRFLVSNEMSKYDVKNYLEKIYNIEVAEVTCHLAQGAFKKEKTKGYIIKEDDFKIAYVMLPKNVTFTFPDLYPEEKEEAEISEEEKTKAGMEAAVKQLQARNKLRPDVPGWFTV